MLNRLAILTMVLFIIVLISSCKNNDTIEEKKVINSDHYDITGTWENNSGQSLTFHNDNSALWIFKSLGRTDTFKMKYRFNNETEPITLDLYDFQFGQLKSKTLYGIVAFANNSFKCDFEAGMDESIRPKDFNSEQVQVYHKK